MLLISLLVFFLATAQGAPFNVDYQRQSSPIHGSLTARSVTGSATTTINVVPQNAADASIALPIAPSSSRFGRFISAPWSPWAKVVSEDSASKQLASRQTNSIFSARQRRVLASRQNSTTIKTVSHALNTSEGSETKPDTREDAFLPAMTDPWKNSRLKLVSRQSSVSIQNSTTPLNAGNSTGVAAATSTSSVSTVAPASNRTEVKRNVPAVHPIARLRW